MESPKGYPQPEGSADPSAKLSAVRTLDKNSGQKDNDGSQDNLSNSEKLTGDHQSPSGPTDVNTETPTEKNTAVPSIADVPPVEGGAGSDEGQSLPAVDNISGHKANDGSQDNPSNSEKSPCDHQSPSGPTGTPTEKNTTVPYVADVPPVEGADSLQDGDKNSGQQANDGSQDNPSNSEKSPGDHQSPSGPTDLSRTSAVSQKEPPNEEIEKQKMSKKEEVELIGPTTTQTELAEETGILGGGTKLLIIVVLVALVAIVAHYYLHSKSPPQKTDWQQVDVFLKQMKKVKARFPNQRAELWSRSEIHLKRHLQTSQPAEPVSLILTSGVRAERTMRCLAQGVASAFSTARNASVLHIDGAGKAGQDSDQVKLDIDRKLQGAFEGDKPVAVIHRLEELPPGSTLIFYRYCDHENAAYKKTFLIFTVLLGDEEEIQAEMRLSAVEEMVDDYLQKRFLSHDHPVSFDRMDLNKYGGLWSRISHLILPVAAEDRIEQEGC
ncbi:PREDICTED: torsin-1A-interacting protein 2-like isoform X2 [Poecilia mexicana]|uniref:torsin-1A-interacting protein 2-like isoform X2 n=1 Tax=Poecilia mexicana TaxID=48701 RepID=UPI00072E788F|nr:PREDICTED: torsin-1A-interacting protein 2-like isoform X2 [Poecilia mexicana]